jgi:hypothetical protein
METTDITSTQARSYVENTNEENAHHFLRHRGYFPFEFIPQGQTVNQTYYMELLKRFCEVVHRKRPELWPKDWILHHDNAPAHKELSVKQLLPKNRLLKWNTNLVLIWLRMTSGCYQK